MANITIHRTSGKLRKTPSLEPAKPPTVPLASPPPRRFDYSLAVSAVALIVAVWAANETRETRLDSKRAQLRAEALEVLVDTRSAVNTFNCYALVKGAELKGKEAFMQFLTNEERQIRDGIVLIGSFPSSALATYEKSLNEVKGAVRGEINEKLMLIRASWDKDLREKADSVCKL